MHSIQVVIAQLMLGLMVFCNAEEAVIVDFDKKFWVCEAGDPKFLGEYITEEENAREGAQVWTNKHDMSIFRNSGVWYMGTSIRVAELYGAIDFVIFPKIIFGYFYLVL